MPQDKKGGTNKQGKQASKAKVVKAAKPAKTSKAPEKAPAGTGTVRSSHFEITNLKQNYSLAFVSALYKLVAGHKGDNFSVTFPTAFIEDPRFLSCFDCCWLNASTARDMANALVYSRTSMKLTGLPQITAANTTVAEVEAGKKTTLTFTMTRNGYTGEYRDEVADCMGYYYAIDDYLKTPEGLLLVDKYQCALESRGIDADGAINLWVEAGETYNNWTVLCAIAALHRAAAPAAITYLQFCGEKASCARQIANPLMDLQAGQILATYFAASTSYFFHLPGIVESLDQQRKPSKTLSVYISVFNEDTLFNDRMQNTVIEHIDKFKLQVIPFKPAADPCNDEMSDDSAFGLPILRPVKDTEPEDMVKAFVAAINGECDGANITSGAYRNAEADQSAAGKMSWLRDDGVPDGFPLVDTNLPEQDKIAMLMAATVDSFTPLQLREIAAIRESIQDGVATSITVAEMLAARIVSQAGLE